GNNPKSRSASPATSGGRMMSACMTEPNPVAGDETADPPLAGCSGAPRFLKLSVCRPVAGGSWSLGNCFRFRCGMVKSSAMVLSPYAGCRNRIFWQYAPRSAALRSLADRGTEGLLEQIRIDQPFLGYEAAQAGQ